MGWPNLAGPEGGVAQKWVGDGIIRMLRNQVITLIKLRLIVGYSASRYTITYLSLSRVTTRSQFCSTRIKHFNDVFKLKLLF